MAEAVKVRKAIRKHRDFTGHGLDADSGATTMNASVPRHSSQGDRQSKHPSPDTAPAAQAVAITLTPAVRDAHGVLRKVKFIRVAPSRATEAWCLVSLWAQRTAALTRMALTEAKMRVTQALRQAPVLASRRPMVATRPR
jgi:hypothetical protein